MNHLLLIGLSVLLSSGVVEAGEKHKPGDTWPKSDGCNTCEMDQYGTSYCTTLYCRGKNLEFENEPLPRELATCDPDMTKCETPCELKMREAMKLADKYQGDLWAQSTVTVYSYSVGYPLHQRCVTSACLQKELDEAKANEKKEEERQRSRKQWDSVMQECVRP